jgi:lipid A disaccharide synthetase
MSEAELNALIKRQQQLQSQKAAQVAAAAAAGTATVVAGTSGSPAQVQIQTSTSSPQVAQQTVQVNLVRSLADLVAYRHIFSSRRQLRLHQEEALPRLSNCVK